MIFYFKFLSHFSIVKTFLFVFLFFRNTKAITEEVLFSIGLINWEYFLLFSP